MSIDSCLLCELIKRVYVSSPPRDEDNRVGQVGAQCDAPPIDLHSPAVIFTLCIHFDSDFIDSEERIFTRGPCNGKPEQRDRNRYFPLVPLIIAAAQEGWRNFIGGENLPPVDTNIIPFRARILGIIIHVIDLKCQDGLWGHEILGSKRDKRCRCQQSLWSDVRLLHDRRCNLNRELQLSIRQIATKPKPIQMSASVGYKSMAIFFRGRCI